MNSDNLLTMLTSNDAYQRYNATKSFVDAFQKTGSTETLITLLKAQAASAGTNAVWGIANSVVMLTSTLTQFIPDFGPVVSRIITSIWMVIMGFKNAADANNAQADKTSQLITAYKSLINEIVSNSISKYDSETLTGYYSSAQTFINSYVAACDSFDANPTQDSAKTTVRGALEDAQKQFASIIGQCEKETYKSAELSMYTYAATVRLALLRDAVLNGVKWGYMQDYVTSYFQKELTSCITTYTNHCITTYNSAVSDIVNATNSTKDLDTYNKVNKLRNLMITYVFDLVQMWRYTDPSIFPNGVFKHQRTRLLLSDVVGIPVDSSQTVGSSKYYKASYDKIAAMVNQYNYHLWRGEHDRCATQSDSNKSRFLYLQNTFTTGTTNIAVPSWATPGTQPGPPCVLGPVDATTYPYQTVGFSRMLGETVTMEWDIIPRKLAFSVGGTLKVDDYTVNKDPNYTIRIAYPEYCWHQRLKGTFEFPNIPMTADYQAVLDKYGTDAFGVGDPTKGFPIYSNNSEAFSFPGHLVYHPFGLGANYDSKVNSTGCLDSCSVAFAPVELCNDNLILNGLGGILIDPIKFNTRSGFDFVDDEIMPGLQSSKLSPGGQVNFKLKPMFPGLKMFHMVFVAKASAASKLTVTWNTTVYTVNIPASTTYVNIVPDTPTNMLLNPFSTAVPDINAFDISLASDQTAVYLQHIILIPDSADAVGCNIL